MLESCRNLAWAWPYAPECNENWVLCIDVIVGWCATPRRAKTGPQCIMKIKSTWTSLQNLHNHGFSYDTCDLTNIPVCAIILV